MGETGHLFIVSAPSGAGKTTLCRALLNQFGDIDYSVSYTTRKPREGESEGIDYFYISKEEFTEMIKDDRWAEWAEVHGNYYGTSSQFLKDSLLAGKDILLDVDVQGAGQILEKFPDSVTIFIMPPSMDVLRERLVGRGADSSSDIEKRLRNAEKEIEQKDMYRYIIVNDDLEAAKEDFISVFRKYRNE